jgi:hypothetical protein
MQLRVTKNVCLFLMLSLEAVLTVRSRSSAEQNITLKRWLSLARRSDLGDVYCRHQQTSGTGTSKWNSGKTNGCFKGVTTLTV